MITGVFTSWQSGVTRAGFGPGISVGGAAPGVAGPVSVQGPTQITASLQIDAAATLGVRTVTVETGAEVLAVDGGFLLSTVDGTAPTVLLFNPPVGATNVPLNAEITVEFNEPMDRNTITSTTLRLIDSVTAQTLPATLSVDATGRIATLVPSVLMAVNRQHQIALTGGTSGIKDRIRQPAWVPERLLHDGVLDRHDGADGTFRRSAERRHGCARSTLKMSALFDRPINPTSRPAGFQVTQGGANVPGTYVFSDNNRRITFTPAADLSATATYTIALAAALSDTAGNGLKNAQTASFTTGTAADTTAPQTTQHNPSSNDTAVPINTVVRVFFNEPINPLTLTPANFRLFHSPTSQEQKVTVLVAPDRRSATLMPVEPLLADTTYFYQLASGYQDIAGNNGFTFGNIFFTTGGETDNTPPSVVQVTPTPGATNAPVNAKIVFQMSELVDDASVRRPSCRCRPPSPARCRWQRRSSTARTS